VSDRRHDRSRAKRRTSCVRAALGYHARRGINGVTPHRAQVAYWRSDDERRAVFSRPPRNLRHRSILLCLRKHVSRACSPPITETSQCATRQKTGHRSRLLHGAVFLRYVRPYRRRNPKPASAMNAESISASIAAGASPPAPVLGTVGTAVELPSTWPVGGIAEPLPELLMPPLEPPPLPDDELPPPPPEPPPPEDGATTVPESEPPDEVATVPESVLPDMR